MLPVLFAPSIAAIFDPLPRRDAIWNAVGAASRISDSPELLVSEFRRHLTYFRGRTLFVEVQGLSERTAWFESLQEALNVCL